MSNRIELWSELGNLRPTRRAPERALPKSAADRDDAAALMRHSVMRDRATDYVNLMTDAVMALAEIDGSVEHPDQVHELGKRCALRDEGPTSPQLRLRERRAHSVQDC
jgi:hypothetical protein